MLPESIMPKFFVTREDIQGPMIVVRKDVHHIVNVLRKEVGDQLILCDGLGNDYTCQIIDISGSEDQLVAKIVDMNRSVSEPAVTITLYQSLPKGDKMELILQKGVELGISRFVPFYSERSLIHLDEKRGRQKVERWQKITEAAAKQCSRGLIPTVEPIHSYPQVLAEVKDYELAVLCYEHERAVSLKTLLSRQDHMPKTVSVYIGPEGGFAESEVEDLISSGANVCGLGPRILRTETAGFTAASLILYQYGQME